MCSGSRHLQGRCRKPMSTVATAASQNVADGTALLRLKTGTTDRSQTDVAKGTDAEVSGHRWCRAFLATGSSGRARAPNRLNSSSSPRCRTSRCRASCAIRERMQKNPGFQNIDTDLRMNTPELRVRVNRDKVLDVRPT